MRALIPATHLCVIVPSSPAGNSLRVHRYMRRMGPRNSNAKCCSKTRPPRRVALVSRLTIPRRQPNSRIFSTLPYRRDGHHIDLFVGESQLRFKVIDTQSGASRHTHEYKEFPPIHGGSCISTTATTNLQLRHTSLLQAIWNLLYHLPH